MPSSKVKRTCLCRASATTWKVSRRRAGSPPSSWAGITSSDSSSWDHETWRGQKGCFAVSSMREFPILPPDAVDIITRSRNKLKQLIAKNIEAEHPKMDADSLAELVLTFFTGLSMEHNLSSSRRSIVRKIEDLMSIVRTL